MLLLVGGGDYRSARENGDRTLRCDGSQAHGPDELACCGEITPSTRRARHPAAERGSVQCQLCPIRHSWHACEHLRIASDQAVDPQWFETYRHILRHDSHGSAKVIRALCYLRDKAGSNRAARAAIERELAFFRKRMRYRHPSDRSLAIGSGVVEAANKTLVTQKIKRSGMRWRIASGQALLTFRAVIKSIRFDRAWAGLMGDADTPANDNNSADYTARRAA